MKVQKCMCPVHKNGTLIIFCIRPNQAVLDIIRLALLTPLRRLILPIIFLLVTFLFCLVDGLWIVLRWRVDRVEDLEPLCQRPCPDSPVEQGKTYQWRRSSVHELMLRASRYHHQISSFDFLVLPRDRSFTNSRCEGQGLIDCVYLITDIPTHRHSHEHDLLVQSRV